MSELIDKPAATPAARPATAPALAATPSAQPTVTPPVVPPPHVQVRPEPRRPGRFRRFVRSVFSHLIFAALVTAGVFGYVYQDMILGRVATTVCGNDVLGPYTPGGSKSAAVSPPAKAPFSTAAAPPPAAAPTAKPVPTPVATPAPVADTKPAAASEPATKAAEAPKDAPKSAVSVPAAGVVPPPAKIEAAKPDPAKTEAAKSDTAKSGSAKSAAATTAPSASTPPAAAPAPAAAASPAIAAAAPPVSPPLPSPAATTSPPAKPDTAAPAQDPLTSAWRAAREAFNAGKPDAIDAYKSLLRSYPDVPDLAGELGNIYYAAGKWREASESYYEAAQRYLKSPQPGYAACLLDVLRNLRSPDAERLAPQITRPCPAVRSGQPGQNSGQTASNPPRG